MKGIASTTCWFFLLACLWLSPGPVQTRAAEETTPAVTISTEAEVDSPEDMESPEDDTKTTEATDDQSGESSSVQIRADGNFSGPNERIALFGKEVRVKPGEKVQVVVAVMGTATVEGDVEGDVVFVMGRGKVNAKVGGNLVCILSSVELGPNTEVHGDAVAVGNPFQQAEGVKFHQPPVEVTFGGLSLIPGLESVGAWFNENILRGVLIRPLPTHLRWPWMIALFLCVINFIIAALLAKPVGSCVTALTTLPLRSFAIGMLVCILFFPLLILLTPTIIGAPLLLFAMIAALLLGKVAIYQAAGCQIGHLAGAALLQRPLVGFLAGTALFYLSYMIPVFGWMVWFLVTPIGVGAVIVAAIAGLQKEQPPGQTAPPPSSHPLGPPLFPLAGPSSAGQTLSVTMPDSTVAAAAMPTGGASEATLATGAPPLIPAAPPLIASGPLGLSATDLAALTRVGFWPRLGASAIDVILVAFAANVIPLGSAFIILMVAYHTAMWAWKGTTLGGVILGLQVVRLDGRRLDWTIALVRSLASFISLLALGIGFFWSSWSAERQSWHDIVAGTTVVKLPRPISLL